MICLGILKSNSRDLPRLSFIVSPIVNLSSKSDDSDGSGDVAANGSRDVGNGVTNSTMKKS